MNSHTPRFEYSRKVIQRQIDLLQSLTSPFELTVRYAVKANPHPEIIKMMSAAGINFDASSSYEAANLLALGIDGSLISLSSQQSPHNLGELLLAKVNFVATSVRQLRTFLDQADRPDTVAVRINPNVGYGHNNRTSTGGINASFGIWHEYISDILTLTDAANVKINRIHIHVGSGANPDVWGEVMEKSLEIIQQFPDATTLDIGGGFKVHRYSDEPETDIKKVFEVLNEKLIAFKEKTSREIRLEIEPGTFFIAHAGTLVATIDDIVDTGKDGFTFLRLNTGMNDFLRTTLYGARHEIKVVNDSKETADYIVVGHNCESGDILTTAQGDPETIEPRTLNKASIGDEVRIRDTGAYCASMRAKGYNSFPDAEEIMVE